MRSISSSSTKVARATQPGIACRIASMCPDIERLMAQQASRIIPSWEKTMSVDNYVFLRAWGLRCCANVEHSISTFMEYCDSSSRFEPGHVEETGELPFGDKSLLEGSQSKVLIALREFFIGRRNGLKAKLALCLADFEATIPQLIP